MPTAAGLYYFVHGEDHLDKSPVILIHGAGGTHLHWPPQVRRIAGQRIFAPDLPGHGKSEGVGRQEISEYSAVLLDFMDALDIQSAVLVGLSMGSAIAMDIALRHPLRVKGLGLVGSGVKLRVNPVLLESAAISSNFPSVVQMVIENSYSPSTGPHITEQAARRLAETRPAVLYGDFLACDAFNVRDEVDRVWMPTLLVCGSEDRMTPPKFSEFLRNKLKRAELHILPGAGHMVTIEQPEAVAGLLSDFLDSIQAE